MILRLRRVRPGGVDYRSFADTAKSPSSSLRLVVNTLMLQDVLADQKWDDLLAPEDRRGLTPLFWQHVLPYGEVTLDMTSRLDIGAVRAKP